ncbi:MAG: hypothetical protein QXM56_01490 [Acidilobaceae archaeon]
MMCLAPVIKCPKCGFERSAESFKLLRDPWKFGFYTVKALECPNCGSKFKFYEGVSPRGKTSIFTIPKSR